MKPYGFALLLLITFSFAVAGELAYAHGGGLDSLGCHNDRKQGEYHCHRGELAGQSFASKAEAEGALAGSTPNPVQVVYLCGCIQQRPLRRLDRRRRRLPEHPARGLDRRKHPPRDARR